MALKTLMFAPENFPSSAPFCVSIALQCSMSYPCVRMIQFHHPSFFISMVFLKSIRLVASISVADITLRKVTFFNFTPIKRLETIVNLGSKINFKLNILIGKCLYD